MSTLLSFDTSTDLMSLALTTPTGTFVHESAGGALASAGLVPAVMALLAEAGVALAQVDAIGFGCGPGAFTGLRTACSVAQGLALGAGKPVLPIDSLMLVAEDARAVLGDARAQSLWVAMDARMSQIYAARYAWAAGVWHVAEAPALHDPHALAAQWQAAPPVAVAGSALALFAAELALLPGTPQVPDAASRVQALARLVAQRWAAGAAVDAALALPVYVRDKVAQTTAEREAARAERDGAST